MGTVGVGRLTQLMVELADGPGDDAGPTAYLDLLTRHLAECTGSGSAGLLTCSTGPSPGLVAGSDDRVRTLELQQRQAGEGPVVDALRTGRAGAGVALVEAVERWPTFTPLALEAGFVVVQTLMLSRLDVVLGALDIFTLQPLEDAQLEVVTALAELATVTLLRSEELRHAQRLAGQLQEALTTRIPIEQAKGALGQLHGVDPEEAFQLLRGYARRHRRNLNEVALGWLAHPEQFPELGSNPPPA